MIIKIVSTLLILVLILAGYLYYTDWRNDQQSKEFARYAGAIAETSVAAELYRNNQDSFFIARDSILNKYALSRDDLLRFKNKYKGKEYEWAVFWDKVVLISDSLVAYQESLLAVPEKSQIDSANIK